PKLFESLTVWEHLQFIASAYRVADYEDYARQLLDRFELTEKKDALAGELSRGMRQKLAICCAYLHRPAAILFDEPLTGLDPTCTPSFSCTSSKRRPSTAASRAT